MATTGRRSFPWAALVLASVFVLPIACSDDESPQEPVAPQETPPDAAAPAAPAEQPAAATEAKPEDAQTVGELNNNEPAPQAQPAAPAEPAPAKMSGQTTTRFVKAQMLNVRSSPSLKGKVVRKLNHGDSIEVQIQGKWAKIGEGEYVRTKYLSSTAGGGKAASNKGHKGKHKGHHKKAPAEAAPAAQ